MSPSFRTSNRCSRKSRVGLEDLVWSTFFRRILRSLFLRIAGCPRAETQCRRIRGARLHRLVYRSTFAGESVFRFAPRWCSLYFVMGSGSSGVVLSRPFLLDRRVVQPRSTRSDGRGAVGCRFSIRRGALVRRRESELCGVGCGVTALPDIVGYLSLDGRELEDVAALIVAKLRKA